MNITDYFAARYPFVWITGTEEERTIRSHRKQLKTTVKIFSWDIAQGYSELTPNADGWTWKPLDTEDPQTQPGEAITEVLTRIPQRSVIYMKDYHKYFEDITVIRRTLNIKEMLKATARMIVFMSAKGPAAIPVELKNDVTPFTEPLPTAAELAETVKRVSGDQGIKEPEGTDLELIVNSLIGLTEELAESTLCLCLVQKKRFEVPLLIKEKARLIESISGLKYNQYSETLDDLAGNRTAIDFLLSAAPNPISNAVLLYGVPGCGKSHIGKAIANALKWPHLEADFNAVRSKYQGETEANLDRLLDTVEALGRVVVFADEIDKSIKGSEGGADSDGGTGARIVGRLLRYFQDKKPNGSFWIMTANSLQDILTISGGALLRRFDALFFLDLPNDEERRAIIKIWSRKMNVEIPEDTDTRGYTGADIMKLAKMMQMLNTTADRARRYVIPTAQALGTRVDEIRRAAKMTCIPANDQDETPISKGRRIDFGPAEKGGS